MLDKKGFDLWADGYDKSVGLCEENNDYPFAGYKDVLGTIYKTVLDKNEASILDIGFGTGVLTSKLYEKGYKITGVDFSTKMIEAAKEKMPKASLIEYDFSKGIPEEIASSKFDYIIATYSLHHLNDDQKIDLIKVLLDLLNDDGKILIGDVAFDNEKQLNDCKDEYKEDWDNDEIYFVYDKMKAYFKDKVQFKKISFCSGVLTISK